MSESPIRLILADDHPIVLQGLQQFFERDPGFQVVASCVNGDEAILAVRTVAADVIVLDLRMPGRGGLEVMKTIIDEKRSCRIVVLTAALHDQQVEEVLTAGAKGFVLKESTPLALMECVRKVHQGGTWVDGGALTRVLSQIVGPGTRQLQKMPLTARELEIVRMVGLGLRNREISERLKISEGTVKIHLHHAYEKLGVDGRLELVLYAQEQGWI